MQTIPLAINAIPTASQTFEQISNTELGRIIIVINLAFRGDSDRFCINFAGQIWYNVT